jgi:hypothetical protein
MHQFSGQSNNPTRTSLTRRFTFAADSVSITLYFLSGGSHSTFVREMSQLGDPYRCCSYCLFRNSVPPTSLMFGPITSIVGTTRLFQFALRYSY